MMMQNKNTGGQIILISFLIAFLLTAFPLPIWVNHWRPAWVAMVVIYWCMALPHRVGIGTAWCLGLLLDVQQGVLLGQNALGLALIAYFIIQTYQRFRIFPLVQQSCLIGFIIIFYLLISSLVKSMIGIAPPILPYWASAFSSMVLWPWLFIILRNIRHKYHIG